MDSGETISERLRRRRQELGLSLADAARRAGTSAATLCRYETGWNRFELRTLRKMATALGCELRIELNPLPAAGGAGADHEQAVSRLGRLFWDRPLQASDFDRYPDWVFERVLEYGDIEDLRLLQALVGRRAFTERVASLRRLSPRTASFWRQVLQMEGVPCTRKCSRDTAWNS